MNFKYLGEAVVLLVIAWSIMRWVIRSLLESDARLPDRDRDPPTVTPRRAEPRRSERADEAKPD